MSELKNDYALAKEIAEGFNKGAKLDPMLLWCVASNTIPVNKAFAEESGFRIREAPIARSEHNTSIRMLALVNYVLEKCTGHKLTMIWQPNENPEFFATPSEKVLEQRALDDQKAEAAKLGEKIINSGGIALPVEQVEPAKPEPRTVEIAGHGHAIKRKKLKMTGSLSAA